MELDKILQERLTNDSTAQAQAEYYQRQLEAGCERDPEQEKSIKLARLEARDTAKETIKEPYFYGVNHTCPSCGESIDTSPMKRHLPKFCECCGQRLKWE